MAAAVCIGAAAGGEAVDPLIRTLASGENLDGAKHMHVLMFPKDRFTRCRLAAAAVGAVHVPEVTRRSSRSAGTEPRTSAAAQERMNSSRVHFTQEPRGGTDIGVKFGENPAQPRADRDKTQRRTRTLPALAESGERGARPALPHMKAEEPRHRLPRDLAAIAGTAALWVSLYWLNDWAFPFLEKSQAASWIFLPAALRLIAVLIWGVPGALGLWLGAVVTSGQVFGIWTPATLVVAPMSALAPLLAVSLMREPLALEADLSGLSVGALTQLAIANATCSALLHSLVFLWLNDPIANPADIMVMLVGDLVGTLVVLFAFKLVLAVLPAR